MSPGWWESASYHPNPGQSSLSPHPLTHILSQLLGSDKPAALDLNPAKKQEQKVKEAQEAQKKAQQLQAIAQQSQQLQQQQQQLQNAHAALLSQTA